MKRTDKPDAPLTEDGRYRLLVEAVTDFAIYMLDANGVVASWNPGAQRFKGYNAKEIIGQHFSRFYTEEDHKNGLPAHALKTSRLQGKFEGKIHTPGRLHVAKEARMAAEVDAGSVIVEGEVEGNLSASDRIELL